MAKQVDPENQRVKQEYKKLQKTNICHRCGKKPVNILFLPWRHLVIRDECAEEIEKCLHSDQEILGTVQVFNVKRFTWVSEIPPAVFSFIAQS